MSPVGARRRRNEDEELIQGEPSVVRRSRRQNDRGSEVQGGINGSRVDEAGEDQLEGNHAASAPDRPPERPSVAEQASRQVTAILEAGEEAAAEIKLRALKDAEALRERLLAEAETEADGIRVEAEADAKRIRREGHAAAATLREEAIAQLRDDVERMCARWGEELLASARKTIEGAAD
jgi:vacuolar-type H+-ATPase subunit E/Vma4